MENHEKFEEIRQYIKDNPTATVEQIAEAMELEHETIVYVLDSHSAVYGYLGCGKGGGWLEW